MPDSRDKAKPRFRAVLCVVILPAILSGVVSLLLLLSVEYYFYWVLFLAPPLWLVSIPVWYWLISLIENVREKHRNSSK